MHRKISMDAAGARKIWRRWIWALLWLLGSGTAAAEERVTVFEGQVLAASVQAEGDGRGFVYGFQSAQGEVWVGHWPGMQQAVKVASRAQLGCLALDGERVLVAVWERPLDKPVSEAVVYAFPRDDKGEMSAGEEVWRPTTPPVWPEVGERCALLVGGGRQFVMLLRARDARDTRSVLDLWWLPSFKEGRPLGFTPRIPKVIGRVGALVGLSVVAESGGARGLDTLWVRVDGGGGLVSEESSPQLLTPTAGGVAYEHPDIGLVVVGEALAERPGVALGLHLLVAPP